MTPDLDELERLAKAATPGPWICHHSDATRVYAEKVRGPTICRVCRKWGRSGRPDEQILTDGIFIAASNPQAVLALTAEIRRLRAELETFRTGMKSDEVARAFAERDALRAEVDRLKSLYLVDENGNEYVLVAMLKEAVREARTQLAEARECIEAVAEERTGWLEYAEAFLEKYPEKEGEKDG